jgi:hypothetical protein
MKSRPNSLLFDALSGAFSFERVRPSHIADALHDDAYVNLAGRSEPRAQREPSQSLLAEEHSEQRERPTPVGQREHLTSFDDELGVDEPPTRLYAGGPLRRPQFAAAAPSPASHPGSGPLDQLRMSLLDMEPRRQSRASLPPPIPAPLSAAAAHEIGRGPVYETGARSVIPAPSAPASRRSARKRPGWFVLSLGLAAVGSFAGVAALLHFAAPKTADLVVRTTPADALVVLDGQALPGTGSPYQATGMAFGEHQLLVSKPGYGSVHEQLTLDQHSVQHEVTLPAEPQQSSLSAATQAAPPSAGDTGELMPPSAANAEGTASDEDSADEVVQRALTHELPGEHKASWLSRHRGLLRLTSNAPSAVYVDGKYVGNTPLRGVRLRPGQHKVAVENAVTNQRKTLIVRIAGGEVASRSVDLADE